ncbi:hypothetical protein BDW69DRAFT_178996 [Aspergillus filifer]
MISHCLETEVKHIFRQRIAHLLGAHEIQVIAQSIPASELPPKTTPHKYAVTKLAAALGKTTSEITQQSTRRRNYAAFYYEFGPGAIPLLGESPNRQLLEKNLTGDDVDFVIKNVKLLPGWKLKCEEINFAVASSILKGLRKSGWDGKSHYNTRFMTRLADFIDLDAFRELGKFQRKLASNMLGTKRKHETDCPETRKQFRGSQSDPAHRSPSHSGLSCQTELNFHRPPSNPDLTEPASSEPALSSNSGQTEMSTDTEATTIFSPKSPALILSATAPGESLAQDITLDEITTPVLNNLDFDWEKFDSNRVIFASTPENLDHGWEQSLQSPAPLENLDHAWTEFVRLSENLDHGWEQFARDLGWTFDALEA